MVDVQLKRRYDLIPNLVETVKGYAQHEKALFENITHLRSQAMNIDDPAGKAKVEGVLTQALGQLRIVAENYPELKANENFLALQNDLADTENKISGARQGYNEHVLRMNNRVQMFPSSIVAGMFNFGAKEFFEVDEPEIREVPKVNFSS